MASKTIMDKVDLVASIIMKNRKIDVKTKYKISSILYRVRKHLKYRIPIPPVDVSEDGKTFCCPTCGQYFEAIEGFTVDDFICCQNCGQLFKQVKTR